MADDFSQRAAKGQAYNLAVSTAIADGKQHDNEYIVAQFLRHLAFAQLVQSAQPEQLSQIVKNPKLVKLIKELDAELRSL
jgi:hypothetical protein